MGNSKSKSKSGLRKKVRGKEWRNGKFGNAEGPPARGEEFEDIELSLLRRAIEKNPEGFVLNNLMMCVQFFRNYEE